MAFKLKSFQELIAMSQEAVKRVEEALDGK